MIARKIKDLTINNIGLLSSILVKDDMATSLGTWWDGIQQGEEHTMRDFTGLSEDMRVRLDRYINIKIGKSSLLDGFIITENMSEFEIVNIYKDIATILLANEYTLNNAYYSTLLTFNPLDNYDRNETQTHNDKTENGARTISNSIGERNSTSTQGARHNSTSSRGNTTAFDTVDYAKGTDGNSTEASIDSATDTAKTNATVDTTTTNAVEDNVTGGYTLRARGNIGTTQSTEMLDNFRESAIYNFFDIVVDVIKTNITNMIY